MNYFADATSRRPSKQVDVNKTEAEIAAFNLASIAMTTEEAAACAASEVEYSHYKDRLVVPKRLREKVLDILHAAHQGIGSMQHRASQMVYWPGIMADVKERTCTEVAPS